MVRAATIEDAHQISDIYNYYILNSSSTFEKTPNDAEEIVHRINKTQVKYPWLVLEEEGIIKGYAYATDWVTL